MNHFNALLIPSITDIAQQVNEFRNVLNIAHVVGIIYELIHIKRNLVIIRLMEDIQELIAIVEFRIILSRVLILKNDNWIVLLNVKFQQQFIILLIFEQILPQFILLELQWSVSPSQSATNDFKTEQLFIDDIISIHLSILIIPIHFLLVIVDTIIIIFIFLLLNDWVCLIEIINVPRRLTLPIQFMKRLQYFYPLF